MDVWVRYIVNKDKTINDVIQNYNDKNFHASVDYPGQFINQGDTFIEPYVSANP